jgi:hypothetical protein
MGLGLMVSLEATSGGRSKRKGFGDEDGGDGDSGDSAEE